MDFKRHNILLITVLAGIFFCGCRPSPDNAEQYYRTVISVIDPVVMKEEALIFLINQEMKKTLADSANEVVAVDTSGADIRNDLDAAYTALELEIAESINEAGKIERFDDKSDLRDAAIELLREYQTILANEYAEILKIVKTPAVLYSDEDDNRFLTLTEEVDTKLQEKIDNFIKISKTFANEYQFSITTDSSQTHN